MNVDIVAFPEAEPTYKFGGETHGKGVAPFRDLHGGSLSR